MISCEADNFAQQGNRVARPLMPTPADVLVGTHEDETRSVSLTITFIRIEYDLEGNAQRFGCLLELPHRLFIGTKGNEGEAGTQLLKNVYAGAQELWGQVVPG
jgi:hypothetical protein